MDAPLTLARLAATRAGASRVLRRHGLDFCCGGDVPLAEASRSAGLDPEAILAEIAAEDAGLDAPVRWHERSIAEIVEHVLRHYHEPLRCELPRLAALARTVEEVHRDRPSRPRGLAEHLDEMQESLGLHMQKEEEVLFPLLCAGRGAMALVPIQAMEQEHRDHGGSLARIRALTADLVPPPEACSTWRALYLGLAELERELMEHIHLENYVLFPRAVGEASP